MPDEGQEGHQDGGETTPSGDATYSVKLGLVAAPEIPEKIAREFASRNWEEIILPLEPMRAAPERMPDMPARDLATWSHEDSPR